MATLAEYKERISYLSLSRTFRDAVQATRQLGYQYLRIDSLCIVQDYTFDWEVESCKMPSIYGDSVLTLSALSAVLQMATEGYVRRLARRMKWLMGMYRSAYRGFAYLIGSRCTGFRSSAMIHTSAMALVTTHCVSGLGSYRRGDCP